MADENNNATVERLLERFSQLKEMERAELALQEVGEGDEFNLFVLREEILAVRKQLKWLHVDGFYDGKMCTGRAVVRRTGRQDEHGDLLVEIEGSRNAWENAHNATSRSEVDTLSDMMNYLNKYLTGRQQEVLTQMLKPPSARSTARYMGVSNTTVSRTLTRAKGKLRRATENVRKLQNRLEDQQIATLDMYVDKDVLICLPSKLAQPRSGSDTVTRTDMVKVVEHLRNGEAISIDRDDIVSCLTSRQVEILDLWADGRWEDAQVNRSTLCRTMQRIGDRLSKSLLWWKDEDLAFLCMKNRRYLNAGRLSSLARGGCLTVEFNGVVHTISEWAKLTGIPKEVIRGRLFECGWSVERALTERPKPRNRYYSVQKERR